MATRIQVTFDCADPNGMAAFWAAALGYQLEPPPAGWADWESYLRALGVPEDELDDGSSVADPSGTGPAIYFQRVPERKSVKNRLHLDLSAGGGRAVPLPERVKRIDAEAERLVALGATKVRVRDEVGYAVAMLDPEGNEFDIN